MNSTRMRMGAGLAAIGVLATALLVGGDARLTSDRPNILVFLTDDQPPDSLPHDPPVMPYLQGRMEDPRDHWVTFPNAVVSSPLCCPSRATLLTGRYPHHTGVRDNDDGHLLDESSTIATWLDGAGYHTGLFGKYLNGYPFGPDPYVPPGWDRWAGKVQLERGAVYYDYPLVHDGVIANYGSGPQHYSTDLLAGLALDFLRSAPDDAPFFLLFAPTAPHGPFTPAPRHEGIYGELPIREPAGLREVDITDKPAWIRQLPPLGTAGRAEAMRNRRSAYEALLAEDEALRRMVAFLRMRGELEETVIVVLSDNGISLGEHGWIGKSCPYEECVGTPFVIRFPGATGRTDATLVSNVDVGATLADVAGVRPGLPQDGVSLLPRLEGTPRPLPREGVLIQWVGGRGVPAWRGIRTGQMVYVELETGERELYDLAGIVGPPDPFQLLNRADDPAYAKVRVHLAELLQRLAAR